MQYKGWKVLTKRSRWICLFTNRDTETSKGTQTVQPIVLVELEEAGVDVHLDDTSERYRWIGLCPLEAEKNREDPYVLEALNRLQAWNPNY